MDKKKIESFFHKLDLEIKKKNISNWICRGGLKERQNIYFEKDLKKESELSSRREFLDFEIFKDFPKEKKIGTGEFSLNEEDTIKDFERHFEEALFMCKFGKSNIFKLPKKGDLEVDDKNLDYKNFYLEKFIEDFKEKIILEKFLKKIKLAKLKFEEKIKDKNVIFEFNQLELHTTYTKSFIKTSTKIFKSSKKNYCYLEIVMTAKNVKTKEEREHIIYEDINNIYLFDFFDFFLTASNCAKDKLNSSKLKSFKGSIILNEKTTKEFFLPLLSMNSVIFFCSAKAKFQKISNYNLNEKIINTKHDKLSIYLNALLKNNSQSAPYDSFGISGKRTCILKNNILKQFFASKQYADYLGIKPTGPFGVVEIEKGKTKSLEFFKEKEYCVLESFASFTPDAVSGDFSAEIRLGYHIKNGVRKSFEGGLFSGNIFKLLEDFKMSFETQNAVGFIGPKNILFYNGEIVK